MALHTKKAIRHGAVCLLKLGAQHSVTFLLKRFFMQVSIVKFKALLASAAAANGTAASLLVAAGIATWSGGKPKGGALRLRDGGKSVSQMVLDNRN